MDTKGLGKKLKSYRAKRGWSGADCAERIGISSRYLSDIERGDKVPTLETFVLILNTLQASADDVLQDSLVIGYEPKSNELLKRLYVLDINRRKQALELLESILSSLEKI
ncbi:helix-turn-helix domain-containing protein [Oscillibacter sp. MSJ-2]|uniref:Helix-turn-helix domain-containing protein n=1 Tax=Dysosmobacter acutus TaxID=2841504 RepID=A0ABS6F645_9FIRM|nr:helix-turn-helix domain-containing protein [Dysosmobacter acutus]